MKNLAQNVMNELDAIIVKHESDSNNLLQILLDAQNIEEFSYISKDVAYYLAEKLQISLSRVYEVITFFAALSDKPQGRHVIQICNSTSCSVSGFSQSVEWFEQALGIKMGETTSDRNYTLKYTPCFGACHIAPAVRYDDKVIGYLTKDRVEQLLAGHEVMTDEVKNEAKMTRYITENFGKYDGKNIDSYINLGGYQGLKNAINMGYEKATDLVKESGLQGRGGAEYPTGKKLMQAREAVGERRFLLCNADEGEPGTFKDGELLKKDIFKVIEGITTAAFCANAHEGYIYCREEYVWMHQDIRDAIRSAYDKKLLGENIMGSDFSFDLKLFSGGGAYVCGEGFAMCESMEGKSGRPRSKPPYVKQAGYLSQPTLVINVETVSAIATMLKTGADGFRKYGTPECPGTKVISVSGKVRNPAVYEVEFGTPLKDIIKLAGGMIEDKEVNFVQIGGASGGILPGSMMDTPYSYQGMKGAGLGVGSGAIVVANSDNDIIEYLQVVQEFFRHESCGKCSPCREGNRQLVGLFKKFVNKSATKEDLEMFKKIVKTLDASLCGGGRTEVVPFNTAYKYFEKAFLDCIVE